MLKILQDLEEIDTSGKKFCFRDNAAHWYLQAKNRDSTALLQSGQAKALYCPYIFVPRQAKNRDSTALLQSGQAKVLYCPFFVVCRQAKNRDSTALLQSADAKVLYCPYFLLPGTNKVPYCPEKT